MPRLAVAALLLLAAPAAADEPPIRLPGPAARSFAEVATVTARFDPPSARPGDAVTLTVTVTPAPGCYTYPLSKAGTPGAQSTVRLPADGPVAVAGDIPVPPGYTEHPSLADPAQTDKHYESAVTFAVPVTVKPTAAAGKQVVKLTGAKFQACTASNCFISGLADLPTAELEVLPGAAAPPPLPPAPTPPPPAGPTATNLDGVAASLTGSSGGAAVAGGLSGLLAAAVFWGFVSLATPCVFPMIPITVSLFLKQADQSAGTVLRLAAVYSLTIVVVLGSAAVLLLTTFQALSVNEWMNLFLGALFVFFALSLFGMFEVTLPRVVTFAVMYGWVFVGYHALWLPPTHGEAWVGGLAGAAVVLAGLTWYSLSGRGAALESRLLQTTDRGRKAGGLLGTVAGALAFSIVSFTCVAPFLGGFAGVLQGGGYSRAELALAGLAFAAAFASPFFVLALFPSLVKQLPKSGGWLDTVKVVMGFLELAAAFKFFRTAELRVSGAADLFSYELCLAAWVGICLAAGLYLLNLYRLPHDFEEKGPAGVVQLLLAVGFLGLGAYLAPGLAGHRPSGGVYAWANAFLLPDAPPGRAGELAWSADLPAALDAARRAPTGQQDRVFVDFTGVTCANCKYNERTVFPRPEVQALMKRYRLVQLYTDTVPPDLSPGTADDRDQAGAANLAFQQAAFGTVQLPLYVVLAPRPDGTTRRVAVYDEGKINDPARFAQFLERGLAE